MKLLQKIFTLGVGLLLLAAAPASASSEYPSRSITLIVPFAAGGPTDIVARIISENISRTLGQQIIIENVVGAGGTTAAIRAMRSAPDGYTIIMGHMGTHAAAVSIYPNLAYNPATDFEPIGMVVGMPVLILVNKDLPVRDLAEFIAYAKQHPQKLSMAHAGVGSVAYTTCHLFNSVAGIKSNMVAFQGTGPAMGALLAGKVDYMCDQIVSVVPQAQANAIHPLAISTKMRSPALPDVPTAAEVGLPEFDLLAWNALFAPKATPQAVIDKLNSALSKALDDQSVRQQLQALGGEIPDWESRSPQALSHLVKAEIAKWVALKAAHPSN